MNQKRVCVAFIDSGVSRNHNALKNSRIMGATLHANNIIVKDEYDDNIGHGTAVVYSFLRYCPDAECYILKIFDSEDSICEDKLIAALEYLRDNSNCPIINISCGLSRVDHLNKLYAVCEEIFNQGRIIVASFDNDGSLSYPAVFEHVIGVDTSTSCFKKTDLQFVDSRIVNLRGFGYSQKLPNADNSFSVCAGSSFVAPYVSALVAKGWEKGIRSFDSVLQLLKKHSFTQVKIDLPVQSRIQFQIKKAALFPFNKEMHAILAFNANLSFDVAAVYDYRYSGKVGTKVSESVKLYNSSFDYTIDAIENIEWDIFDTLVIGHTSKIELITGKPIKAHLVSQCLERGKNIYFFDMDGLNDQLCFQMEGKIKYYSPEVSCLHVQQGQFGKLYEIGKPIVGFWGTSPKQGKMSTQMLTKIYLENLEYKVGALGTEPNSILLGFDEEYNMGFNSTVQISGEYAIQYINGLLHNIELKNPDIIFVGSQSQTVCLSTGNIGFYPYSQYELLLATQPDVVVLSVNIFDSDEYVNRTITFLESACETHVLCLVMFPIQYDNYQGHLIGKGTCFENGIIEQRLQQIRKVTNRPVFLLDENTGINVGELCINFFGEEAEEK